MGYLLTVCTRFRRIATFGNATIRKFQNNTSEMKKLAGRDMEDILQVSQTHASNGPCPTKVLASAASLYLMASSTLVMEIMSLIISLF
jgi:hypothetical protein